MSRGTKGGNLLPVRSLARDSMGRAAVLGVPLFAAALALMASCSWGGYSGNGAVGDAGTDQPCDGVVTTCAAPLLCVWLECRTLCAADSDCPSSKRCLLVNLVDAGTKQQGVCVDSASVACNPNSSTCSNNSSCACPGPSCPSCPSGAECASDGTCRNSSPCAGGETFTNVTCSNGNCGSPGACYGLPPHDKLPSGSGTGTGTGTSCQTLSSCCNSLPTGLDGGGAVYTTCSTTVSKSDEASCSSTLSQLQKEGYCGGSGSGTGTGPGSGMGSGASGGTGSGSGSSSCQTLGGCCGNFDQSCGALTTTSQDAMCAQVYSEMMGFGVQCTAGSVSTACQTGSPAGCCQALASAMCCSAAYSQCTLVAGGNDQQSCAAAYSAINSQGGCL